MSKNKDLISLENSGGTPFDSTQGISYGNDQNHGHGHGLSHSDSESCNSCFNTEKSLSWVVFISGNGSNLQALLDSDPKINISLVVSSKAEAFGVERAKKAGVPVLIFTKENSWDGLSIELKKLQIDRIFLAGFMKVIPASFINDWENKILNLHPSLLPSYKGLKAIERSFEDGAAIGITIHWVTAELDAGPILLQKEVFPAGSTRSLSLDSVKDQVHKIENKMVVEAVWMCHKC